MDHRKRLVFVFLLILRVLFLSHPSVALNDSQPFTVLQNPDGSSIPVDTPINLTLLNNLGVGINSVVLHYCCLEPEFVCHFPGIIVEKNPFDSYSVVFTPEYGINSVLGYNFEITVENDTIFHIPNSLNYSDTHPIRKASDNLYYFSLDIVKSNQSIPGSTASSQATGVSILIVFSLLVPVIAKKQTSSSVKV